MKILHLLPPLLVSLSIGLSFGCDTFKNSKDKKSEDRDLKHLTEMARTPLSLEGMTYESYVDYPIDQRCDSLKELIQHLVGHLDGASIENDGGEPLCDLWGPWYNNLVKGDIVNILKGNNRLKINLTIYIHDELNKDVDVALSIDDGVSVEELDKNEINQTALKFDQKLIQFVATVEKFFKKPDTKIGSWDLADWQEEIFRQVNEEPQLIAYEDYEGNKKTVGANFTLIPDSADDIRSGTVQFDQFELDMGVVPLDTKKLLFGFLGCVELSCLADTTNSVTYKIFKNTLYMTREVSREDRALQPYYSMQFTPDSGRTAED